MKFYKILLISAFFFSNTTMISHTNRSLPFKPEKEPVEPPEKIIPKNQLQEFLCDIGKYESGNDYSKVNSLGYMGRFQFGIESIKTLGYHKLKKENFINNPTLQDTIMMKNLRYNKRRLKKYYPHYVGKIRWGIHITESGMLAAAHLAGQGNVKKFLMYGKNREDINGTTLSNYLTIFGGYNLNLK